MNVGAVMQFHRLLAALAVFIFGLLVVLLIRSPDTGNHGSVLRGRGLEIVDDERRVWASIRLHPASVLARFTLVG